LLDARLALGRAELPAEVLLRDDVRRRLRPELRELDALLLEGRLVFAWDEGVADFPFDLVERVAAGDGEVAPDGEGFRVVDDGVLGRYLCCDLDLLRRRHCSSDLTWPKDGPGSVGRTPDSTDLQGFFALRRTIAWAGLAG